MRPPQVCMIMHLLPKFTVSRDFVYLYDIMLFCIIGSFGFLDFLGTSSSDIPVVILPSLNIPTGISIRPSSVSLMQGSLSGKSCS